MAIKVQLICIRCVILLAPPGNLYAMVWVHPFFSLSLGPTSLPQYSLQTTTTWSIQFRAHYEHTQSTFRAHSKHTQRICREHSENTQEHSRTPREHSENTQRTLREHSEYTQKTLRVHPKNTQSIPRKHPENTQRTLTSLAECTHIYWLDLRSWQSEEMLKMWIQNCRMKMERRDLADKD